MLPAGLGEANRSSQCGRAGWDGALGVGVSQLAPGWGNAGEEGWGGGRLGPPPNRKPRGTPALFWPCAPPHQPRSVPGDPKAFASVGRAAGPPSARLPEPRPHPRAGWTVAYYPMSVHKMPFKAPPLPSAPTECQHPPPRGHPSGRLGVGGGCQGAHCDLEPPMPVGLGLSVVRLGCSSPPGQAGPELDQGWGGGRGGRWGAEALLPAQGRTRLATHSPRSGCRVTSASFSVSLPVWPTRPVACKVLRPVSAR